MVLIYRQFYLQKKKKHFFAIVLKLKRTSNIILQEFIFFVISNGVGSIL